MEEKRPPGAFLFQEYEKHFAMLDRPEQGDLVMAMFYYMRTGEVPEGLPPVVRMAFGFIRDDMDRDTEKYRKKCERNANNGRKGGRPKNPEKPNGFEENPKKPNGFEEKPTETDSENEKPKKANYNYNHNYNHNYNYNHNSECIAAEPQEAPTPTQGEGYKPPSLEEVAAYCRETESAVSAQTFHSYYAGNGWMVSGIPLHDWRAKLRYWDAKEREKGKTTLPENRPGYTAEPDPLEGLF